MEEVEQKVMRYISAKRLTLPLCILFSLFIVTCLVVIYLAAISAFRKLDETAVYNVDSKSEAFEYLISSGTSPDILLQNFVPVVHNCQSMPLGMVFNEATLEFKRNVRLLIERKSTSKLKITAVAADESNTKIIATMTNQFERCQLERRAVFEIILGSENPVFSMHVVGELLVGRTLSDAADSYYPLVSHGQIIVQDKTTFTKTPLSLAPQPIRPGDTLRLTGAKGIIRATHDDSALLGVFSQEGNQVLLQHLYSDSPEVISPSFIDRVASDSELAFALSVSLFVIQFAGFGISTMFRLAFYSRSVARPIELKARKKWRKPK